jgi:hypothetical protein
VGTVLTTMHAGVRCVFPVHQVILAEGGDEAGGNTVLWPNPMPEEVMTMKRTLRVSTSQGTQSITCSRPRLSELTEEHIFELPGMLEDILNMPYVVGIAEIEGALHWVIDARGLQNATGGS